MVDYKDIETSLLDLSTALQNTGYAIRWQFSDKTRRNVLFIRLKFMSAWHPRPLFQTSFQIHRTDEMHFEFFKDFITILKERFTEPYTPEMKRTYESEFFHWRCTVCDQMALSPIKLEEQHLVGEGVIFTDSDNSKWLKCDSCKEPYHACCGGNDVENISNKSEFHCTFYGCKYLVHKPKRPSK